MAEDMQPDPGKRADRTPSKEGTLRFSGVQFLAALLLLIVSGPFLDAFEYGILVESVLMTVVLFSALMAIGGRRSTFILGSVLVIPALAGKWLNFFRPDLVPPEIFLSAAALFTGYVIYHLFGFILRASRVSGEVLCAAVANYLMLGLLWSFGFTMIAAAVPEAFVVTYGTSDGHVMKGANSLYFSYATLCTIGYGDIVPVSAGARMLAILEAVVGMFYMTILIARLVAIYSSDGASANAGGPGTGKAERNMREE